MAYYRTCPDCGAHLDPSEKCDCMEREESKKKPGNVASITKLSKNDIRFYALAVYHESADLSNVKGD